MTTVHRHPLAGSRHLTSLDSGTAYHLAITWRCLGELDPRQAATGSGRAPRSVETHVRLDVQIDTDRDAHLDAEPGVPCDLESLRCGHATLSVSATSPAPTGDSSALVFRREFARHQPVRIARSARWMVIELGVHGTADACRLVAIFDLAAGADGTLPAQRQLEHRGEPHVRGVEQAHLAYVSTDVFTRLGIPGGRYDRPAGQLSRGASPTEAPADHHLGRCPR